MSACNRLDLQTLGSQPVMPKNLPDHCSELVFLSSLSVRSSKKIIVAPRGPPARHWEPVKKKVQVDPLKCREWGEFENNIL